MNITSTAIAVALAVIIGLGLLLLGPSVMTMFFDQPMSVESDGGIGSTPPVTIDQSNTSPAMQPAQGSLPTTLTSNDSVKGTGPAAKIGDTVTVKYVGRFPDGTIFDASDAHAETKDGFNLTLGTTPVIEGWTKGLVGMQVGGKRQLIVPPSMGYGPNDYGPIPGNSTLIFDIELLKIGQ